ncbi:hypothetical protein Taro_045307 [Colocasia esculenta]|uniref:Myb-like domain-containing protein n=1 Tax=Colocasia esculenta TaxID=4460 RepID=A0A843X6E0_COLES|nr:hypothetical protein [Colocasia esculenta]
MFGEQGPDPSPSSANSDPNPTDPASADAAPPLAVVALGRLSPSQAAASASARHSSSRRLPPPCWTHEETEALIQSYRQKWYALRRGNLRASHWEEVADAVSRRCRHLYTPTGVNSPKTAVQCRHKMEKLRKRYRSEKKRPHRTSWVHFREMDAMEMGTHASTTGGPAAAGPRPKAGAVPAAYSDDNGEDESDDEDNDDDDDDGGDEAEKNGGVNPNIRSIHAVMSKSNGGAGIGNLRFQIPKAVRSKVSTPRGEDKASAPHHTFNSKPFHSSGSNGYFKDFLGESGKKPPASTVAEEMRKRVEEKQKKEREGTMLGEMVAAVRMLGDGFIRVEEMKMEMAREMEKLRMEMELKRTEMILESQRRIVDAFVRGVGHENKKKKPKVNGDGHGDR